MGRQRCRSCGHGSAPSDQNGDNTVQVDFANGAAVAELQALDDEYLALEAQYRLRLLELDREYEPHYAALLEQRRQRLAYPASNGVAEVCGDAQREQSSSSSCLPKATPGVPGFWKVVLQNSAEFQEDIEEHDEPVLDYLRDIRCEPFEEGELGFRLVMAFDPNPYFSNMELVKLYHTSRKNQFIDRVDCVKIEAPTISWRSGKNVTVETVTRKAKGGGRKKQSKPRREEVSRASFFRGFFRNLGPDEDIPEEELQDEDEDDMGDLMECLLTADYEQALALRESIVPHAVRWYTGDACDDDDDDTEEEDEEGEEEGVGVKLPAEEDAIQHCGENVSNGACADAALDGEATRTQEAQAPRGQDGVTPHAASDCRGQ